MSKMLQHNRMMNERRQDSWKEENLFQNCEMQQKGWMKKCKAQTFDIGLLSKEHIGFEITYQTRLTYYR